MALSPFTNLKSISDGAGSPDHAVVRLLGPSMLSLQAVFFSGGCEGPVNDCPQTIATDDNRSVVLSSGSKCESPQEQRPISWCSSSKPDHSAVWTDATDPMSALAPGTFFSHDDMVGERFVHVTAFDAATANSGNSGAAQTRRSPAKTDDDESLPGGMGDGSVLGLGSDWGLMCSGVAAAIFLLLSAVVALAGRVRRLEKLLGQPLEQDKPPAPEPSSLCLTTPTSADDVQCVFKCGDGAGGRPSITGVGRPLSGVLRERVSVLDFGAKNDGTAASTLSCCFVDWLP